MYEQVQDLLREASAVLFDIDSVVIKEELIDELAKFLGKDSDAVSVITQDVANGKILIEVGLKSRLDMIKPTTTNMKEFIRRRPFTLTPNIKPLLKHLQERKIPIYLKTSGFDPVAREIAKQLSIRQENIFTNRLKFYYNGLYAGFDEDSLTAHSSGIGRIVKLLKSRHGQIAIIGNSIDNMEKENFPPCECYIGYGGNKLRHPVRLRCKWYVTDFREIHHALITGEQDNNIEILRRFLQGVKPTRAVIRAGVGRSSRVTSSSADDSKPSSSTTCQASSSTTCQASSSTTCQASSSKKSDCEGVDSKGSSTTCQASSSKKSDCEGVDSKGADSKADDSKTSDNKPTSSKGRKGRRKK